MQYQVPSDELVDFRTRARAIYEEGHEDFDELPMYLESIIDALARGRTVLRIPADFHRVLPLDAQDIAFACVAAPTSIQEAYVSLPSWALASEHEEVSSLLVRHGFAPSIRRGQFGTARGRVVEADGLCTELEKLFEPLLNVDRITVGHVLDR